MATNPIVWCVTCDRHRDCTKHLRAEHPPTAAKAWLRKRCSSYSTRDGSKLCDFRYRAGVAIGGRAAGQ